MLWNDSFHVTGYISKVRGSSKNPYRKATISLHRVTFMHWVRIVIPGHKSQKEISKVTQVTIIAITKGKSVRIHSGGWALSKDYDWLGPSRSGAFLDLYMFLFLFFSFFSIFSQWKCSPIFPHKLYVHGYQRRGRQLLLAKVKYANRQDWYIFVLDLGWMDSEILWDILKIPNRESGTAKAAVWKSRPWQISQF